MFLQELKSKADRIIVTAKNGGDEMRKTRYITMFAALCMLAGTGMLQAAEKLNAPKLMQQYAKAPVPSALLLRSYRYMGALKAFSIDAVTTSDDVYEGKMIVTYTHHVHIDLKRPNYLYVETSGDLKEKSYYLNNGYFTIYDQLTHYYGELEIPHNIDKALDFLFEKYDVKSPLANILYTDLDRRIPPKEKGYYFGHSDVDGIACHHLGFITPSYDYQVWIEEGERPLIRKFIIVDTTQPLLPRSGTVLRWHLDIKPDDARFQFNKPSDAIKIDITAAQKKEGRS